VQREADYALGVLTGRETMRDAGGALAWTREHAADGANEFTTYWPGGGVRTRSSWRDLRAEGVARLFASDGREQMRVEFEHGRLKSVTGEPGEY
jgi:hypothetical protein